MACFKCKSNERETPKMAPMDNVTLPMENVAKREDFPCPKGEWSQTHVTFANGWILSIGYGSRHYRFWDDDDSFEIAVKSPFGIHDVSLFDNPNDSVRGHLYGREVSAIALVVSGFMREREPRRFENRDR